MLYDINLNTFPYHKRTTVYRKINLIYTKISIGIILINCVVVSVEGMDWHADSGLSTCLSWDYDTNLSIQCKVCKKMALIHTPFFYISKQNYFYFTSLPFPLLILLFFHLLLYLPLYFLLLPSSYLPWFLLPPSSF